MNKRFKSLLLLTAMLAAGNAWADDLTISSAEDWNAFCAGAATYASGNITLEADIEVGKMFPGTFTGTLDGQGHTLTCKVNNTSEFALLNTTGDGALVKNLKVDGDVKSISKVAGLIMNASGATTIENVKISTNITTSGYPVSGFIVNATGKVNMTGCEYSGTLWCMVSQSADCAGFISRMTGGGAFNLKECAFTGVISEEMASGAVAGWRAGGFVSTIENIAAAEDCYLTGCAMTGEIREANGSERIGGFIGSPNDAKVSYIIKDCLMSGKVMRWTSNTNPTWMVQENTLVMGCSTWRSVGGNSKTENCYFTSNAGVSQNSMDGFTKVDDSAAQSGALCYRLNGNQSDIHFYQTLGTDAAPVLDKTHGQVYASGRKHCDGSDYEGLSYNNVGGETQQDEHHFTNGVCDYCQSLNIAEDGYFHATSQETWEAAVKAILKGNNRLNVKLECDIEQHSVIDKNYSGIFDGQGHTIDVTMGSMDKDDTDVGSGKVSMFGNIGGATIRNCVFVGNMIGSAASAPIANYNSAKLTVENVISLVNMTQTTTKDGNFSGLVSTANNPIEFRNCIVAGRIDATKDAGGFVGWAGGQTINLDNCVMIGDVTVNQGASSVFLRIRHTDCKITLNNCYYLPCTPHILNGNNSEMVATAKVINDEDMIYSGALCYALNGDQSQINFYQNLGEDDMPMPFSGHAQVYASGHKHCDGTDYDDVSYNNESGETVTDEHDYVDNFCSYCGKIALDENGTFHIASNAGFAAFAKAVKEGQTALNAVVEEDLAVSIGDEDCPVINNYTGTFDGQGHTIYATVNAGGKEGGIFGFVRGGTYKNIVAEGTVRNATQAGFIGTLSAGSATIENVIVNMDIEGTANVAGLVGCFDQCDGRSLSFKNVLFGGKAKYVGPLNGNGTGGFVAWSGTGAKYTLENCAMVADIDLSGQPQKSGYFVRANNGCTFNMTNCAYIPVPGVMYVNGHSSEANNKAATVENATDGSLCWMLNNERFDNPTWFQTLDDDMNPVLDSTHGIVYPTAEGYSSKTMDEVKDMASDLVEEIENMADTEAHPAQKTLVEALLEAAEALNGCSTFEELVAAYYPAVDEARVKVLDSQKAYDKLTAKVEETRQYLEDNADHFKGYECYQKLETYLSDEYVDPDEDEYPNGSYTYIIDPENLLLDEAGIEEEMAFIDKMVKDALNEGLNAGADATQFIANADFSNGFNDWEGTKMTAAAQSTVYTGKYIAESWSTKPFDMYQTIRVPENGIYELTFNGAYRIQEYGDSHQSSAMAYLNGNKTYLQADIEDMIPAQDAQDKVNAWITGDVPDYVIKSDEDEVIGYTTHGQQGAACAFFNEAPRYENRILVNVTDNMLTIGFRNGHGLTNVNEWVALGNMKLTYCGTLDEAGEALDATLASMKARADFILAQNPNDEPNETKGMYPNYATELKTKLAEKVAAIAETDEAEQKYALVEEISDLFQQIYDCKVSYKKLYQMTDAFAMAVDEMTAASELSKSESDAAYLIIDSNWSAYLDGSFTNEQAGQGGNLSSSSLYPNTNEEGVLEIANYANLNTFAGLVNGGNTTLNAVLTQDVTVTDSYLMIGNWDNQYAGVFDGQGHTITADFDKSNKDAVGIFSMTGNCTIKNLRVSGNISGKSNTGAFIGQTNGNTTLQNVVSSANVTGLSNVGGFAGGTSGSHIDWTNCLWDGKVKATEQGAGGYVGWSSDNTMSARNCLAIGEVEGRQLAYMFRVKCTGTIGDAGAAGCVIDAKGLYIQKRGCIDQEIGMEAISNGTPLWWGEFLQGETTIVGEKELASGMVCFELNEGETSEPAWRQTLGQDAHPLLLSDHGIVCLDKDGNYANKSADDDDAISAIQADRQDADAAVYNLSGQRVSRVAKGGLYIIGGKKYLVK